MLIAARMIAINPKIVDELMILSEFPASCNDSSTIITDEMALVTDISGV